MPLLIADEVLEEYFVLHDQTSHQLFLKIIEEFKAENKEYSPSSIEYLENILSQFSENEIYDSRAYLQDKWASFKNIFKFQPLDEIKEYFGVKNAIYFGYVGSFISMLWFGF